MPETHNQEPDPHLEEDHYAPSVTMPQGTQAYGTQFEHEQTDIQTSNLTRWWIGLGAFCVGVQILMWGMFGMLNQPGDTAADIPTPMFRQQQVPPEPRLLPNPVDSPTQAGMPHIGPMEYRADFDAKEDQALNGLGLRDPNTGLPMIPAAAVAAVSGKPAPAAAHTENRGEGHQAGAGVRETMPSDSSGGTLTEDRLR